MAALLAPASSRAQQGQGRPKAKSQHQTSKINGRRASRSAPLVPPLIHYAVSPFTVVRTVAEIQIQYTLDAVMRTRAAVLSSQCYTRVESSRCESVAFLFLAPASARLRAHTSPAPGPSSSSSSLASRIRRNRLATSPTSAPAYRHFRRSRHSSKKSTEGTDCLPT